MYTLVFVDRPDEGFEPWQQLERVLESLEAAPVRSRAAECSQRANGGRPASRAGQAVGSSGAELSEGTTSASSRAPGGRATGSRAAQSSGLHSQHTVSRAAQPEAAAAQWHRGRALLARRSGVFSSAVCRNESLDALGHLSSDGCMRPWLPSYANLPKPQETPAAPPLHEVLSHCNLQQTDCSAAHPLFVPSQSLQGVWLLPANECMDDPVKTCRHTSIMLHHQGQAACYRQEISCRITQMPSTMAVCMSALPGSTGWSLQQGTPQRRGPRGMCQLTVLSWQPRSAGAGTPWQQYQARAQTPASSKQQHAEQFHPITVFLRSIAWCVRRPGLHCSELAWLHPLFRGGDSKDLSQHSARELLSAVAGLLRMFLGRPDRSCLQAASKWHCEGSACICPQSVARARLPSLR